MHAQRTCECGCGELIAARDRDGRKRRFVFGHQSRLSPVDYIEEARGHTTPCWVWQGGKSANGYATLTRAAEEYGTRYVHIHRYMDKYGPVPEGLELDHLCRVRACVNPDHLEPVSHAVNGQRGCQTKLNLQTAAEVRRLALAGWRIKDIGDAYGISDSIVSAIRRGKRWANA